MQSFNLDANEIDVIIALRKLSVHERKIIEGAIIRTAAHAPRPDSRHNGHNGKVVPLHPVIP